ncbi:vacuolar protein sorting-associated protein 18 homolog [Panonychus citri]|uniref:vacuolar protein sorting-associated protein 18 homolog n=1 Tax=Panonychus citri TaxID=50023 RepID=UPI0023079CF4|nr:vacuolar protein sorting-associated protein 18 homolog [Panonychus citri]
MLLFDQYDEESSTSFTRQYGHPSVRPKIIGSYEDEEGKPSIFKRHRINFQPEDVITHLAVSNNQMILAMMNKKLLRIDLMNPDQPIEIELAQFLGDKSQLAKLYQVYLSPSGKHSLLSFASDLKNLTPFDNLYLSKKIHQASKLKGHLITALAWNFLNEKDNTTSNILIGTSKGLVFETELAPDETKWLMNTSLEKYYNQVFDTGPEAGPITGIQFHRVPGNDQLCFILVTTSSRLYQCVGKISSSSNIDGPYLVNIFNNNSGQFQDMPNNLGFSRLDFYFNSSLIPETFGWLTEPGILHGKIVYDPSFSLNTVTKDATPLSFTDQ